MSGARLSHIKRPFLLITGGNGLFALILSKFYIGGGDSFIDNEDMKFVDNDDMVFLGTETVRASTVDYAGAEFWKNFIWQLSPITVELEFEYGGMISPRLGFLVISDELFDSTRQWPPSRDICVDCFDAESDALIDMRLLFSGNLEQSSKSLTSTQYKFIQPELDVNILDICTDPYIEPAAGVTIYLPRIIGDMSSEPCPCLRLTDRAGKPTFWANHVTGTLDTHWHIQENGQDASPNATDNGDGTFSLNAWVEGLISVTGWGRVGTSLNGDLESVLEWAADRIGHTIDITYVKLGLECSKFIDQNGKMLAWISKLCGFWTHLFWRVEDHILGFDMDENNGSRTIADTDEDLQKFPNNIFTTPPAIKEIKSTRTRYYHDNTVGHELKSESSSTTTPGPHEHGKTINIEAFSVVESVIQSQHQKAIYWLYARTARLNLNLASTNPEIQEQITHTNTQTRQDITAIWNVHAATYDLMPDKKTMLVEGKGAWSA